MTGDADGQRRNDWDATDYDEGHGFVHEYGRSLVDLLDPQPGERVLDLGCGTGHLTADIADAVGDEGTAIGIDQSTEMIAAARDAHSDADRNDGTTPRFRRADARSFAADETLDAVFSNAALHWIPEGDQNAVLARVTDALAPGGRFVAELGGTGNVERITRATLAELRERGHGRDHPWYFPSVGAYAPRLEDHGFEVRRAVLFDRPTDLDGGPDGLRDWLGMFGDSLLAGLDETTRDDVLAGVEDRLREELYDPETETWTADYRRLRFVAVRESADD